jgi:hypothetical protein
MSRFAIGDIGKAFEVVHTWIQFDIKCLGGLSDHVGLIDATLAIWII